MDFTNFIGICFNHLSNLSSILLAVLFFDFMVTIALDTFSTMVIT